MANVLNGWIKIQPMTPPRPEVPKTTDPGSGGGADAGNID